MYRGKNSSIIGASMRRIIFFLLLSTISLWAYEGIVRADGAVCGDGVRTAPEQCDDGNLLAGDGCSLACNLEVCGNGIRDTREQCDDNNTDSEDGCSALCFIEFCGDGFVQRGRGEECDDSNGINGDGCSNFCAIEDGSSASSSRHSGSSSSDDSASSESSESSDASESSSDESSSSEESSESSSSESAESSSSSEDDSSSSHSSSSSSSESDESGTGDLLGRELPFLGLDTVIAVEQVFKPQSDAQIYLEDLQDEEQLKLVVILKKILQSKPLTKNERVWSKDIAKELDTALKEDNAYYGEFVEDFFLSPIAREILLQNNIDPRLVLSSPAQALKLLKNITPPTNRKVLAQDTKKLVTSIGQYGITVPADLVQQLDEKQLAGATPREVFFLLTSIKSSVEKLAIADVGSGITLLRAQVETLSGALPFFVRGYGVDGAKFRIALDGISATLAAPKPNIQEVVIRVEKLIRLLESSGAFDPKTLAIVDARKALALRRLSGIIKQKPTTEVVLDERALGDIASQVAEQVSEEQYVAFSSGGLIEQRRGLLLFLDTDPKIDYLRRELTSRSVMTMEEKFSILHRAIESIGEPKAADPCSASIEIGMQCIQTFLTELEDMTRQQSIVLRIVGTLQDFFGIEK